MVRWREISNIYRLPRADALGLVAHVVDRQPQRVSAGNHSSSIVRVVYTITSAVSYSSFHI